MNWNLLKATHYYVAPLNVSKKNCGRCNLRCLSGVIVTARTIEVHIRSAYSTFNVQPSFITGIHCHSPGPTRNICAEYLELSLSVQARLSLSFALGSTWNLIDFEHRKTASVMRINIRSSGPHGIPYFLGTCNIYAHSRTHFDHNMSWCLHWDLKQPHLDHHNNLAAS